MICMRYRFWRLLFVSSLGCFFSAGLSYSDDINVAVDDVTGLVFTSEVASVETDEPVAMGDWTLQTTEYHDVADGNDAIESNLGPYTYSRLHTTIEGPAELSFWWKKYSEQGPDTVSFTYPEGSIGETLVNFDWKQRKVILDSGSNDVYWEFKRDNVASLVPEGQAWIDEIVVTPISADADVKAAVEYAGPVDMKTLTWSSAAYTGAVNDTVAKTDPTAEGESAIIFMQVEGPAVLEFDWGMESENSDVQFLVDGEQLDSITATTTGLVSRWHEIGPGTHNLQFRYNQNESEDGEYMGENEAYLDNLTITPFGEGALLANAIERSTGVSSAPYPQFDSWRRQSSVSHDGFDAAAAITNASTDTSRVRKMFIELPDEPGLLKFWYNVVNEGGDSDTSAGLQLRLDGQVFYETYITDGWVEYQINAGQGENRTLEAWYYRYADTDTSPILRAAYIDQVSYEIGKTNYQPDLTIQPQKRKTKGANIYNSSGAGQIGVAKAKRRRPVGIFNVAVQNESPSDADGFRLSGSKSNRHFETFFIVNVDGSNYNYTASFVTGRFYSVNLSSGQSEAYEVWVRRKRRSTRRSRTVVVRAYSAEDSRKVDVVKAKVKVSNK